MGKCSSEIKEIRFVIEKELTQCYIAIVAYGDCPIGVQGWHHKTYPASMSVLQIMQDQTKKADYLEWPLKAPR